MDTGSTKRDALTGQTKEASKPTSVVVPPSLRHLDVDDFYLMRFLSAGQRLIDVARTLSLSQPAITQRVYKIENALGFQLLDRSKRSTVLTPEGLEVCLKMAKITALLEELY